MKCIKYSILLLLIVFAFSGCSNRMANTKIDLGKSEVFTYQDLEAAANIIFNEIKTWNSVSTVYSISYCGDRESSGQLDYCKSLSEKQYTQCVVFESSFKSAGSSRSEGFNPNSMYDGWCWYLARTDGGEWELLTWGYA